jgi:hypothetical protein
MLYILMMRLDTEAVLPLDYYIYLECTNILDMMPCSLVELLPDYMV